MNQYLMVILPCLGLCLLAFFFLTKRLGAKAAAIIVLGVILLETVLVVVRDHVISFSSPEEAFVSSQGVPDGGCEVILGEETAFVIGKVKGTLRCVVVEKAGIRWKNGSMLSFEHQSIYLADGCFVTPFYKNGTQDYYIMVSILSGEDHVVCDSKGSAYQKTISPDGLQNYISHINETANDFIISIDGIHYSISLDRNDS